MRGLQKTAALWIGLSLLILLMADATQSPAAEEAEIRLQWAFGALTGPEDNPQFLSVEKRSVLHSGDRIKIFLQPQTDCHLYLFYRSSQGEMTVLLPTEGSGSRAAAGERITVPAGSQWFRLDEVAGLETFYLLASARRLESLDKLCSSLSSAGNQSDREDIGRQILSETTRLQKKRRSLTAAAERPIRIGGNLRGHSEATEPELPDISRIALEISASGFYSRTFTIDHR